MTNERVDQILRQTLSPMIPDENLNRNLKREMEEKRMKHKNFSVKRTVILAAACCLLVGTVSVAASGKIAGTVGGSRPGEFTSFGQLTEAENKAGFEIKAVEAFGNGYTFSEMSVGKKKGLDENGNVLIQYKDINISYEKAGGDLLSFHAEEAIYSSEGKVPDKTAEIGGVKVDYYLDTYKWVPAGYELTAEDEENLKKDNYYISEGADELSVSQVATVVWTENGIKYLIQNVHSAMPADVLFGMAEEVILQ